MSCLRARKIVCEVVVEERLDPVVQRRLVSLDGQNVIRSGVDDFPCDFGLTAHRVDGDQTAGNLQHLQQFWDGCDLVALRVHDHLAQADVIGRRPGADHVNRRFAAGGVEAAAKRFAIDGNNLSLGDFMQRRDPTQETLLELRRFDRRQNRIEAVVRWNAASQIEKTREPRAFHLAKLGNGDKIVGPANDGAHGDDDNIDQRINHVASARIGKFLEVFLDSCRLHLGHCHRLLWLERCDLQPKPFLSKR